MKYFIQIRFYLEDAFSIFIRNVVYLPIYLNIRHHNTEYYNILTGICYLIC